MRKQEAWVLGFVTEKMFHLVVGDDLSMWHNWFIFDRTTYVRETDIQPGLRRLGLFSIQSNPTGFGSQRSWAQVLAQYLLTHVVLVEILCLFGSVIWVDWVFATKRVAHGPSTWCSFSDPTPTWWIRTYILTRSPGNLHVHCSLTGIDPVNPETLVLVEFPPPHSAPLWQIFGLNASWSLETVGGMLLF